MKLALLLAFVFWLVSWAIPREAMPATGCAYPASLDTFTNVSTGTILTAADYNKLLCAVEKLESEFRIPNFTVATKPASPQMGRVIYVTDALNATTCDTGGGTSKNVCVYNGTHGLSVVVLVVVEPAMFGLIRGTLIRLAIRTLLRQLHSHHLTLLVRLLQLWGVSL